MKKILIVDWLDKYGGAERVLTVLNKQFDFDKCFTLVNAMSKEDLKKVFSNKKIQIVNFEKFLCFRSGSTSASR